VGYGAGSSNLYAFGNGDPVNHRDPTGLLCEKANASNAKEYAKRCAADAWDVVKEWWAGDTPTGSTHTEEGPRPGETQEHYVSRLTASGVSNQDAALAGEVLFHNRQVSTAQRAELAKGFLMAKKPVEVMAALTLAPAMAHPAVSAMMAAESYRESGGSLRTVVTALPAAGWTMRTAIGATRAIQSGTEIAVTSSGPVSNVLHYSQVGQLGPAVGRRIVLSPYSIGRTGVYDMVEREAQMIGGQTLGHLPGDMAHMAPAIDAADEVVFYTAPGLAERGGLTMEEMMYIQANEALRAKTTFVYGLFNGLH